MSKRLIVPTFDEARAMGFVFDAYGNFPRTWNIKENKTPMAMDAVLATIPNTTVPAEFLAYVDPRVIDIVTRPRKAREIFNEVQKGDWTTPYAKWRVQEMTGSTQPYTDYGQSRTSGVNYNWVTREQYVFQTLIEYGDFEEAVSAGARISLSADKQRAAAYVIEVDSNYFALFGVAERDIYGILNAPNLSAAITPLPSGTGGAVEWTAKTTQEIYNDILALFSQLVEQGMGHFDQTTPMTLVISPAAAVQLGKATDYNKSVQDMLDKYFSSLKIVTLPELADDASGQSILLIADNVEGQTTGELGFSERLRAGRIIPDISSFAQKWTSTTYGAIIYYPFAIAQMRGILE